MASTVSHIPNVGRAFTDSATLLTLVFTIPFVVLAVGTPIALAILAVTWVGQSVINALSF